MKQEERVVLLHGEMIPVIKSDYDGMTYVSIPGICEALGLELRREETALEARADLWWGHRALRVWTPPGRMEVASCLRSDLVSDWLNGAAGRSSDPDKLTAFRDAIGDVARAAFDPKLDMPDGAILTQEVTFDEPPPRDIVEKLGRLIDSFGDDAAKSGIPSPEEVAGLKILVARARQLRDQADISADREVVSEANRLLGVGRDRPERA